MSFINVESTDDLSFTQRKLLINLIQINLIFSQIFPNRRGLYLKNQDHQVLWNINYRKLIVYLLYTMRLINIEGTYDMSFTQRKLHINLFQLNFFFFLQKLPIKKGLLRKNQDHQGLEKINHWKPKGILIFHNEFH